MVRKKTNHKLGGTIMGRRILYKFWFDFLAMAYDLIGKES